MKTLIFILVFLGFVMSSFGAGWESWEDGWDPGLIGRWWWQDQTLPYVIWQRDSFLIDSIGGNFDIDSLTVNMSLDVDGVAQFLDSVLLAAGTPLCLDSNVATNYLVFSTTLQIVGSADILLDPAGDDVLVDGGLTVGSTTQAGDNNLRVEGTITGVGKFDNQWTATAGANVGNMHKTTLTAGDAFTGTTGHQFKVYDADATVNHNGGEHCAVYANMKLLSAMAAGGKSVIYSGHNYDSGIEIDAGVWLYGKLEDAFKVSGDTVGTGLDLSETVVENYEIEFSNGATITNAAATNVEIDVADTLIVDVVQGDLNGTALAADTAAYAVQALDADTAAHAVHVYLADSASIAVLADSATVAASAHTFTGWEQLFRLMAYADADTIDNVNYRADTSAVTITTHFVQDPMGSPPVPAFTNGHLVITPDPLDKAAATTYGWSLLIKY